VDEGLQSLAQHARATRLLGLISEDMDLNTTLISPVVGTETCQQIMDQLQGQITNWRVQIPIELWSTSLTFTGFYMELLLYEPVLHTPTNKQSFAAPFLIERLSMTDFPRPTLTQHHFDAVQSLKSACQNLIDTATTFTGPELIALPSLLHAPRIAHAAVTLLRLHIAVTVQGNTYGQILRPEDLRTIEYLDKCLEMVTRTNLIDAEAVMARIVRYADELKKWMLQYEASRAATGESGQGLSGFQAKYGGKGQQLGAAFPSIEQSARSPNAGFENDVTIAEFLNPDFVMDDFGLFELFSEGDLGASAGYRN
jgi:hypothetical protein